MPEDFSDMVAKDLEQQQETDFFTAPLTIRQRRAMRAARNASIRGERQLRRAIGDDALEQELQGGRFDQMLDNPEGFVQALGSVWDRTGEALKTFTHPLFDLLQIGQFTTAGAALELQRTGNGKEALKRASAEFLNALPFVDEADALALTGVDPTRASFRDVLERAEFAPFEDGRHNEYATAAAGFVLDVVLDPTTWLGGAGLRLAGGGIKSLAMPFVDLPGIKGVRGALGRKLVPHFELQELARKHPRMQESVDKFLGGLSEREGAVAEGAVEIRDLAVQLRSNLSPTESKFLGLYLDKTPDHFEAILRDVTAGDPRLMEHLQGKFQAFRGAYKDLADKELQGGIFDEGILRADYAPGRYGGATSVRKHKSLMAKLGLPEEDQLFEFSDSVAQEAAKLGQAAPIFTKAKKLNTLEHRVVASIGTELDPGAQFALRGLESVRARATQRFIDSVLSDPSVSYKIVDPQLLETMKKGGSGKSLDELMSEFGDDTGRQLFEQAELFRNSLGEIGYSAWRPFRGTMGEVTDMTSVAKLKKGTRFMDDEGIVYTVSKTTDDGIEAIKQGVDDVVKFSKSEAVNPFNVNPAYVLPRQFIDELNLADNIMSNRHDETKQFFNMMRTMQMPWKGWALASPGYHARNMQSNIFNNMLAGVGFKKVGGLMVPNPAPYAKALALVFGKGDNISLKVGDEVLKGQDIIRAARRFKVVERGLFTSDIPEQVEAEVFGNLWKKGGKSGFDKYLADVSNAKGDTLDRVIRSVEGKDTTRRELLKGVSETARERDALGLLNKAFGVNNPVLQFNRRIGEKVESHARLAHWIQKIGDGMSAEEAALSVKKYLFDYGELTQFEREIMKAFVPFYTWMRKNIPLQFQAIFENPGRYAAMTGKPIDAIESLSEDWRDVPTPDYFQELHAVRAPKEVADFVQTMNQTFDDVMAKVTGAQSVPTGLQPVFINPNYPFQDLNRMNWQDALSSLSPFVKLPFEWAMGEGGRGYSIFLDRPIEKFAGQPMETGVGGTDIKVSRKAQHAMETLFPPLGKMHRFADKARKGQGASQILGEVFGIKAIQVDVEEAERSKVYRYRDKIQRIRQKYRELGYNI